MVTLSKSAPSYTHCVAVHDSFELATNQTMQDKLLPNPPQPPIVHCHCHNMWFCPSPCSPSYPSTSPSLESLLPDPWTSSHMMNIINTMTTLMISPHMVTLGIIQPTGTMETMETTMTTTATHIPMTTTTSSTAPKTTTTMPWNTKPRRILQKRTATEEIAAVTNANPTQTILHSHTPSTTCQLYTGASSKMLLTLIGT